MVDYITIGISIIVFFLYLMIILMSIEIKKRLNRRLGTAFTYIIISILFLTIKTIQQVFLEIEIIKAIPHFIDLILKLIFTILFSLAIFSFYKTIRKMGNSKKGAGKKF